MTTKDWRARLLGILLLLAQGLVTDAEEEILRLQYDLDNEGVDLT